MKIWSAKVPPKVKTFAWKAASEALATEANKLKRGIHVTGICNICGLELEDTMHVLFRCPHASHLWTAMRKIWFLPPDTELQVNAYAWFHLWASHCLANFARTELCTTVWFGSGPEVLSPIFEQDLLVSLID